MMTVCLKDDSDHGLFLGLRKTELLYSVEDEEKGHRMEVYWIVAIQKGTKTLKRLRPGANVES